MSSPTPIPGEALNALLRYLATQESFVFLESTRFSPDEYRSFLFLKPVERLILTAAGDPRQFFDSLEAKLRQGYYLAGWLAYELGCGLEEVLKKRSLQADDIDQATVLADFGVFAAPHIFDHRDASFSGAGPWPQADRPAGRSRPDYSIYDLRLSQSRQEYLEKIGRIKSYIESGDTYQVNYTLKLHFGFAGSDADCYTTLRRNQNVCYGAYIKNGPERIMSFSPELFFRKKEGAVVVRPMKGTIRRGLTAFDDGQLVDELRHDLKNCSENVMIVDLLRNDLGRLCRPGSVRVKSLFDVETYETLHQMTSTVVGDMRPDLSLYEMFRALFPCGSVTGAPKIRTMEIIRELESQARGVYTGSIGFLAPSGEAVFNVPIRTVVLRGAEGEMGIGSGIVYDSDPGSEWDECLLKASFLKEPRPDFELIETLLWRPVSGYWLLDFHLRRLAESARYLGFHLDAGQAILRLEAVAAAFDSQNAAGSARRVRLTLAKDGGLAIAAAGCPAPLCEDLVDDLPVQPVDHLPPVTFSGIQTDSGSLYLYHKTTRRTLYDEERQKAVADGCLEVFFTNERDEVTEGSISNIVIRRGGIFYTPPVRCGLLPGVFRSYLLEKRGTRLREAVLFREDLASADGVYLANSVRGLVQVRLR